MGLRIASILMMSAFGLATSAHADNLVVNGGFETGDFTGWQQSGNTGFNGVQCPGVGFAPEGSCDAFFGPVGSDGTISQTLATVAGDTYLISFDFQPDGGVPSDFSVDFGGTTILQLTNPAASGVQSFSFEEVALLPNTTLAFNFRDDPGFLFLDAVSVVPEPASLALLGAGLAGLGAIRRRKKA